MVPNFLNSGTPTSNLSDHPFSKLFSYDIGIFRISVARAFISIGLDVEFEPKKKFINGHHVLTKTILGFSKALP